MVRSVNRSWTHDSYFSLHVHVCRNTIFIGVGVKSGGMSGEKCPDTRPLQIIHVFELFLFPHAIGTQSTNISPDE